MLERRCSFRSIQCHSNDDCELERVAYTFVGILKDYGYTVWATGALATDALATDALVPSSLPRLVSYDSTTIYIYI